MNTAAKHRRFCLELSEKFELILDIDTSVITEELAHQINSAHPCPDRLLQTCGDIYQAIARRVASMLCRGLYIGCNSEEALELLDSYDEWKGLASSGLKIIDYCLHGIAPEAFGIREIRKENLP